MLLDFEQPIAALEGKLQEMKKLAEESQVDVSDAVKALEDKIKTLKKETYANLTRWQRVQLSRHADRPYTLDYIEGMADKFIELHGDRNVSEATLQHVALIAAALEMVERAVAELHQIMESAIESRVHAAAAA